jgi:hypothetical protein
MAGVRRAVRGLWPDRNPLRRTVDRVEAVVVAGLAVAFLAAAPVAALTAGHFAYRMASRSCTKEAAWHQVPAVLLATAPASGYGEDQAPMPARWVAPDGTPHTGDLPAPPDARAGGTMMVWVDAAGQLTGPPLQLSQARAQAALAAVLAPLVAGLIMLCAGQLAHALLGQRRLAAWDTDWQATEPLWTRRH